MTTRFAALIESKDAAKRANVPFHEVIKQFRASSLCPTCGKYTVVMNIARRGFVGEAVTKATHCACVGGPAYVAPVPAPAADPLVERCEVCGISRAQALFYGDNGCRGSGEAADISPLGSRPGPIIGEHSFAWAPVTSRGCL